MSAINNRTEQTNLAKHTFLCYIETTKARNRKVIANIDTKLIPYFNFHSPRFNVQCSHISIAIHNIA